MHTTNYVNTLIEPAEDCPVEASQVPPIKGNKKSVANLQYEMLHGHPYVFTSDEVLFSVFATRKGFTDEVLEAERYRYFSKGRPCFRASPPNSAMDGLFTVMGRVRWLCMRSILPNITVCKPMRRLSRKKQCVLNVPKNRAGRYLQITEGEWLLSPKVITLLYEKDAQARMNSEAELS